MRSLSKERANVKRQKAVIKEQLAIQNAAMEKENAKFEADLKLLVHTREISATEAAIETTNRRRKGKGANENSISSEKGINRKVYERPSR